MVKTTEGETASHTLDSFDDLLRSLAVSAETNARPPRGERDLIVTFYVPARAVQDARRRAFAEAASSAAERGSDANAIADQLANATQEIVTSETGKDISWKLTLRGPRAPITIEIPLPLKLAENKGKMWAYERPDPRTLESDG